MSVTRLSASPTSPPASRAGGDPVAQSASPVHGLVADIPRRYFVAVAASVGAMLLSMAAEPWIEATPSLFFAAVVISAWYGGLGPGLATAGLSTVALGFLLLSPIWSPSLVAPADALPAGVFLLVAILTGTLTESLRNARAHAETAASRAVAAVGELRLEKSRTDAILQSVSDGITVQDASGRLVYANDAAALLLGYGSPDALVGRAAEEVSAEIGPRDENDVSVTAEELPGRRALAGEEEPEKLVCFCSVGSGQLRWGLIRARPIRDGSGKVVLAVSALHDLTDRIRHERALEAGARDLHQLTARLEATVEQLRLQKADAVAARAEAEDALERIVTLQQVTAALSQAHTPDEVASRVLERAKGAVGARSGMLLAFTRDGNSMEIVRSVGVPPDQLASWTRESAGELARLAGSIRHDEIALAGPALESEGGEGLPYAGLGRAFGSSALAIVPVATRERPLGILALDLQGRGPPGPRDRDLLLALGRQCAQALDRARLFDAERRARDEAEQASLAKSQFLAVVSHELRTPLNAILGYEELLETEVSGPVSSVQKRHLSRIRDSARHLLALIEQILSLSRVQAGSDGTRLEDVDAVALLREVTGLFEPKAVRKGLVLELDVPEVPTPVRTDPGKLRQILLNILSNAVKFTDQGVVRLALSWTEGAVRFEVGDTGPGIPDGEREHIFEPFVQAPHDGMTPSGTGLGLSVARELARHLGGDISVESADGQGSTFRIMIPDAAGATEGTPVAEAALRS